MSMRVRQERGYGRGQRRPTAAELAAVPEVLLRGAGRQRDNRAGA